MLYRNQILVFSISFLIAGFFLLAIPESGFSGGTGPLGPSGCCQHPAGMYYAPPTCAIQTEAECTGAGGEWCQGGYCGEPTSDPGICACPADHTKCYDVKDDLLVHSTHELTSLRFPELTEDCKIIGKDRYFCTPVCKDLPEGATCSSHPSPGPGGGPDLPDQICYWINCRGEVPEDTYVQDQFNKPDEPRLLQNFGPTQRLCAPAAICNPDCAQNGVGSACELQDGIDSEQGVCIEPCTCIPCGASSQLCCSGDTCDSGLTCDQGRCSDCGDFGEQCCSGDTCNGTLICGETTCVQCVDDYDCDYPEEECVGGICDED